MKCSNVKCGLEISDDAEWCGNCGARQTRMEMNPKDSPATTKTTTIGDRVWRVVTGVRLFNVKMGNVNVTLSSGGMTGLVSLIAVVVLLATRVGPLESRCGLYPSVNPPGSGSVVSQPLPDGDGKYKCGTKVELEAREASGWKFDGWTGVGGGQFSSIVVVLSADRQVVAQFVQR